MAGSGAAFRTDVQVKTSLTSGLLPGSGGNRRGERAGGPARGQEAEATSDEYLARFEEDLHKKVDTEIGTLVDGLADCVALAKVDGNDKYKAAQGSAEIELKAETMIRATENLLSLSHTLKLLFLLHQEDAGSERVHANQQAAARQEVREAKLRASQALSHLLARS